MDKCILYFDGVSYSAGDLLFFIAYALSKLDCSDISLYVDDEKILEYANIFNFDIILEEPLEYDIKFSDIGIDEFLKMHVDAFDNVKDFINDDILDEFGKVMDIDNLCVIHLDFGDYNDKEYVKTHKLPRISWLNHVSSKYGINDYNVAVITNDEPLASRMLGYVGIDAPIYSINDGVSLLLSMESELMVGSCSLFSFATCFLNKKDCEMVADYPMFQIGCNLNEYDSIYQCDRITKEVYQKERFKVVLCSLIKDENEYLEEWINHNLSIGFDEIYLFEDLNSESHKDICDKYDKVYLHAVTQEEIAEYEKLYGDNRQHEIFKNFLDEYRLSGDWVAFFDVDEYLMFDEGYNIQNVLYEQREKEGIYVFWKTINANGRIKKPIGGTVKNYTRETDTALVDKRWSFKSIVNLDYVISDLSHIHGVTNGVNTSGLHTDAIRTYKKCWINHYVTRSYEDFTYQLFYRGDVVRSHRKYQYFFDMNRDLERIKDTLTKKLLNIDNSIPKTIHYFLFGGELTEEQEKCIESWRKYLPEYKIQQWNETNYDVNKNELTTYLYNNGLYDLLSDYARCNIMYQYGGLSIGINVEITKPLNDMVNSKAFFVWSEDGKIDNSIIYMAPKENFIDKMCLNWMEKQTSKHNFELDDYITNIFELFKITDNSNISDLYGIKVFPYNYFNETDEN